MITVIGSLNYDFIVRVERFPQPGETLHGGDVIGACGGKGANQAYAAAKLGADVSLIGCVGMDAHGAIMVAGLAAVGVNIDGIIHRAETSSGMAMILVDAKGQNQIVVARGANLKLTVADLEYYADRIRESSIVVAQFEVAHAVTWQALQMAHTANAITVLTPAPYEPFDPALLKLVTYLMVNEVEAGQISGCPVTNMESAEKSAQAIVRLGARNAIVTLGAQGAWVETESWRGQVAAPVVHAVDTVGAGDCFTGTFVARLHAGINAREAAVFACAAAAISVTRPGAQPSVPESDEVSRMLAGRSSATQH